MKKTLISIATASVLLVGFTGCANNSLNVSSMTSSASQEDIKEFKTGVVSSAKKVLINDRKMAALTGAGIGGAGGAIAQGNVKGGLIGAGIGALAGALIGNEVEAWKTIIKSEGNENIAYLKDQLPDGTSVEFITREEGEISNVNIVSDVNHVTVTDAIDKRYSKNGKWHYHLQREGITLTSPTKFWYLNDMVRVEFNSKKEIVNIKQIAKSVIKTDTTTETKTVEKIVYKDRIKVVEKPVEKIVVKKEIVVKEVEKSTSNSDTAKVEVEDKKSSESVW